MLHWCYMKKTPRLIAGFKPEHYQLDITPDREAQTFTGWVVILGTKVGRPSKRLTFHQKGLTIGNAKIVSFSKTGEQQVEIDRVNLQNSYDELRLHSTEMMYPGRYAVTIEFSGKITDDMDGVYPCNFTDGDVAKKLIATQFESHHARKAFPCIDEPEAKATFQLSLVTPSGKNEVVLSNTPAEKTEEAGEDSIRTTFQTTPIMSTYLLAFVYGEMHYAEAKTKDGTQVKSWANVGRPKEQLEYSANEAAKLLDFYAKYYDTPYPLPKLDQVALPDFDAGAMENWGLVTYREIALLTDPKNRSISQEQYVSLVVAHELAHQWFGNLVTMKWWDDLWLNESFAALMEHLSLDVVHPDWNQWEMYTASDIPSITSRDIYKDIQPVGVKIDDVALLETAFDPGIVYAKGARLLKMLREYIGDKDFATALKSYFTKLAYSNSSREDLWEAMGDATDKDIHALMTPWLVKPGMPVLKVEQDGDTLHISQKRFALDVDDNESLWPVPLLANVELDRDVLEKRSETFKTPKDTHVVINQFGSGNYITQYATESHRIFIAKQIEAGKIATEARINILNDMLLLARRGDSSLTDALELVVHMGDEDRDNVWGLMARALANASQLTEGDDGTSTVLRKIRRDLASNWHKKLGWDDKPEDDVNTKQLRHTALAFMLGGEDESAMAEARKRYSAAKTLDDIDAESRATILASVVRHGSEADAMKLLDQYESAMPDVQLDICTALSSTKDPKVATAILTKAIGPKGIVRAQDVLRWLVMFLRNYYIREASWGFLKTNFTWIDKVLSPGKAYDYLPTYCASIASDETWQKKYKELFDPLKKRVELKKNILIGEADIVARIEWRERDQEKITKFLSDYQSKNK